MDIILNFLEIVLTYDSIIIETWSCDHEHMDRH